MRIATKYYIVFFAVLMMALYPSLRLRADNSVYHLDIGVQAGLGYYVGDATPHIFQDVKEVLGAQFRYKVDQRWSVQMKGQWQRIMYSVSDVEYHNPMWNLDATAEFNFFRFGMHPYDQRVKSITPFLFVGVGTTVYQENNMSLGGGCLGSFLSVIGLGVLCVLAILL